ncbi:MAG: hypothetical protein IPP72_17260 [Chitinophagaceae bacterium]|nr:hypothetical protein [Chitinophagaceae bacterium]
MKDKITRLSFKNTARLAKGKLKPVSTKFRIETNPDEDNEELDISIHDLEPGALNNDGTLHAPKKFIYKLNGKIKSPSFDPGNIIIKQNQAGSQAEAIYQFSVSYNDFLTKDNIIILYHTAEVPANEISYLEFFAETEDSFTKVRLERAGTEPTDDSSLWDVITKQQLKFSEYSNFISNIICDDDNSVFDHNKKNFNRKSAKKRSPFIKSEEYNLIKFATDFYMMAKLGMDTASLTSYTSSGKLPYYELISDRIEDDITFQQALLGDCVKREDDRLQRPVLIELIWNYWMEQGMLVQTLNVINLRFQNIKGNNYSDRLQRFDVDPLRPLSHILWGYIQDEQHRLSIPRRLNEYDHEYGLTLTGRAVPRITPVDSRVKFLEAFHNLLTLCTIYFKESDDTTRIADAFPILNSLKEVHLLLAEGNHNAYGNLTWTARQEMLMQQYILSRTEMREFLGGRVMVPYPETWMDRVDTMRNIQGWGGTGIVYYHELASHGEMILLSIRYGNWSDISLSSKNAANWAQAFRNSVQRYIHAYRSVTGIDMSVDQIMQLPANFAMQPAYLIQQRLLDERSRTRRA